MPITGYNADIVLEQGASVMQVGDLGTARFQSGASHILDANASLHNFGQVRHESGGSTTFANASNSAQTISFTDGTLTPTLSIGRNAPDFNASPGAVYIRSDGSMSNWYYNISTGVNGSVWRAAASA